MKRPTQEEIRDHLLLQNSIERVINTTMSILQKSKHPDAMMNLNDWEALKYVTVHLWNEERNRAFIRAREKQEKI